MTTLTINNATANSNTILSLPSIISADKNQVLENFNLYSFTAKPVYQKSASKLFSIDWDLNMNELEFE